MCNNRYNGKYTIFRGSTNLGNSTYGISSSDLGQRVGLDNIFMPVTVQYYDSPSSTSSLTYQLYIRSNGGESMELNSNATLGSSHIGTFTVMEIKG